MPSPPPNELLAPLTEAVALALREMAGIGCAPGEAHEAPPADLCAVLPVTTAVGGGYLALALTEATAAQLARRILAQNEHLDAALIRDCAGELLNVVAGQAKTLLFGAPYHFVLRTPRIESAVPTGAALVIAFVSEAGHFALHANLPA